MEPQQVTPPKNTILIRRASWRPGHPEENRYMNFELPPDVGGAEVRVNAQGYSVYFDRKERRERNNPSSAILKIHEERVSHNEYFFNQEFEEVAVWIRHTDWIPVMEEEHKSILPADWKPQFPQRPQ